MRHGSLFSGIGGFDLAAQWMGWENVFHCEWNSFGQKVLKYYWPEAISYHDITKTDFTIHRGSIDILTGGFPCQPYSLAGKRKGKDDERHLWPEMCRAIREISPSWIVGENVYGIVNWSGGMVFEEVQTDLENQGYEVQAYILPAAAVNAPHRRDRVWFVAKNTRSNGRLCGQSNKEGAEVRQQRDISAGDTERVRGAEMAGIIAHSNSIGCGGGGQQSKPNKSEKWKICKNEQQNRNGVRCQIKGCCRLATNTDSNGHDRSNCKHEEQSGEGGKYAQRDVGTSNDNGDTADTECIRLEHSTESRQISRTKTDASGKRREPSLSIKTDGNGSKSNWKKFPTVTPICDGDDGIPGGLDGITFSKWRKESIKAGGNAVVPQVVYQIFKTIQDYEKLNT